MCYLYKLNQAAKPVRSPVVYEVSQELIGFRHNAISKFLGVQLINYFSRSVNGLLNV